MILDCFRLDGKSALVTGSDKGLGAAIALALAQAGADVALHSRGLRPENVAREIQLLGRRVCFLAADLSQTSACQPLISGAIEQLGRLDILVNNAGTIRRSPAVDYAASDWETVLAVNLTSVFVLCQLAGRHMLERGGGKIINIASLLSFQGGILVPAYAASKGAVAQLTKALANEWAAKGINVNAIAPGYMSTDNTAALRADAQRSRQILERIPAGRWGEPADVAAAAVFLAAPASDYIHGHILAVDGGWLGR
jgi:2-dehydro-3-deoxy-D-gluconate 5-dehydrogenase